MKIFNYISIIFIFFLISCSNKTVKVSEITEKSLDLQVLEAYDQGVKSLEEGDVLYAAKKFNEAEILFHNLIGHQICFDGCIFILYSRLLWRFYCRT